MNGRCLGLSIVILALSSCVIPVDYDEDAYRPRERGRSACVDEAHERGYRNVDVQSVQAVDPGIWEVIMHGRGATGRDVKLSCEYNVRLRRASVGPVD